MADLIAAQGPVGVGRVGLAHEVIEAVSPELHLHRPLRAARVHTRRRLLAVVPGGEDFAHRRAVG